MKTSRLLTKAEMHCIEKGRHQSKLLIGYGHLEPDEIRKGVLIFSDLIRSTLQLHVMCIIFMLYLIINNIFPSLFATLQPSTASTNLCIMAATSARVAVSFGANTPPLRPPKAFTDCDYDAYYSNFVCRRYIPLCRLHRQQQVHRLHLWR